MTDSQVRRVRAALELTRSAIECESSLIKFTEAAWPIIEPGVPFRGNWHLDAIAEHLEAAHNGDITRLLINIPPGHCKSTIASVTFPAWSWQKNPTTRWYCSSYDAAICVRDAMRTRQILTSSWFNQRWPGRIEFANDQNAKTYYENTARGWRMSVPVGSGTGQHPDFVIVDDPHNVKKADSEKQRQAVIDWWDGTMSTRGKARGVRQIVIMQRLQDEDLTGHVLERAEDEGWVQLMLPARYEPARRCVTVLGFEDPRDDDGELLWPELHDEAAITRLEDVLGPARSAGQLQQRPPEHDEDSEWPKAYFRDEIRFDEWPSPEHVAFKVIALDPSLGKNEKSDFSAFVMCAKTRRDSPHNGKLFVDADIARRDGMQVAELAVHYGRTENPIAFGIETNQFQQFLADWIEDASGRAGTRLPVIAMPHYGVDKRSRIRLLTPLLRHGDIRIRAGVGGDLLVRQLKHFPNGDHDDGPDALEMAVALVRLIETGERADHGGPGYTVTTVSA